MIPLGMACIIGTYGDYLRQSSICVAKIEEEKRSKTDPLE
jgi:hypothetical protein